MRPLEPCQTVSVGVEETTSDDFPRGQSLRLEVGATLRLLEGRRQVCCAQCVEGGHPVLVKVYFPHAKQDRDASIEWENAGKIHDLGLPIPAPLFAGSMESGAKVVGYDFLRDGVSLDRALESASQELGLKLLENLVEIHDAQHQAGCYQSDDHLGNYFWAEDRLSVLDAGSYRFAESPLPEALRVKNMAMLTANVPLHYRETYSRVLESKYSHQPALDAESVAQAVVKRRDNYFSKTRRACTEFESYRDGGRQVLAVRDMDQALRQSFLEDPDQYFESGSWCKKGNTCSVVEFGAGSRKYVLKRYNPKSIGYRLLHAFSTPRALSSWSNGHVLRLFGVKTPRPVLCLLEKSCGLLKRAYLLMEKVEGDPLDGIYKRQRLDLVPGACKAVPTCMWQLEQLKVTHGDMKASNLILDTAGEIQLIDLDSMTLHQSETSYQRAREKDRLRFMRNWSDLPEVSQSFRSAIDSVTSG